MTEPIMPSELEHTMPDPEAFGKTHILTIAGELVATNGTKDELEATANDIEKGRAWFAPDAATGDKKPVILAGDGILTSTRQSVKIYMDEIGELGYAVVQEREEVASPTPEATVDAPTAQRRGGGLMDALKAKFRITQREEASGPDPDEVPRARGMQIIDPQGGGKPRRIMVAPDHLNGGGQ